MRKSLYPRLAAQNIKKNSKYYLPYILTSVLSVAMFFIVCTLNMCEGLSQILGGEQLSMIMSFALMVSTILFTIFLFYNQSFLIKRRKTEFGLYSVLGMEKRHISRMCMLESFYTTVISIVGGIIAGAAFSKLAFLLLVKILSVEIPLAFEMKPVAIIYTALVFTAIYTIIFLNTVRQIYFSKTVDLLHSSKVGEKEPKASWVITLIGLAALISGYTIALTTESPLLAIQMFTFAVILVMIGTYCLFTSGSIHFLKLLKKNKSYYYKTKNFVSISGMIYRVKQNAIGLGNICIFCTAVLVILSSTVSLYVGMEDALRTRYPRNISVSIENAYDEQKYDIEGYAEEKCREYSITPENIIEYDSTVLVALQKDNNTFSATEEEINSDSLVNDTTIVDIVSQIYFISVEHYNKLTASSETLNDNEVLLCELNGQINGGEINFGDYKVNIKARVDNIDLALGQAALLFRTYYIIVPDLSVAEKALAGATKSSEAEFITNYFYGFDTQASAQLQINCTKEITAYAQSTYPDSEIVVESSEESRESVHAMYGGLLFIGLFLGVIFIAATVLIIYYKQISEGYDDKERFEIMQKVGMDKSEIKKSINSQVLTVFFLPLVTAFIHLAVAFPIITKLLALLQLSNVGLFALSTVVISAVFAILYAIVYAVTARVYFKIVN